MAAGTAERIEDGLRVREVGRWRAGAAVGPGCGTVAPGADHALGATVAAIDTAAGAAGAQTAADLAGREVSAVGVDLAAAEAARETLGATRKALALVGARVAKAAAGEIGEHQRCLLMGILTLERTRGRAHGDEERKDLRTRSGSHGPSSPIA